MMAASGDATQVAPDVYKTVFENDRVRVLDVHMQPGAKSARHSHPDYVAYLLSPAKVKFTAADGTSAEAEFPVGAVPQRLHSPGSAAADVARAYQTAQRERRTVVLAMPLDVQAASCEPPPARSRPPSDTPRAVLSAYWPRQMTTPRCAQEWQGAGPTLPSLLRAEVQRQGLASAPLPNQSVLPCTDGPHQSDTKTTFADRTSQQRTSRLLARPKRLPAASARQPETAPARRCGPFL